MNFFNVLGSLLTVAAAGMQVVQYNETKKAAKRQRSLMDQQQEIETQKREQRRDRFLKSQRAAYSKAGIKLSGSPTVVLNQTDDEFDLENEISGLNYQTALQNNRNRVTSSGITAMGNVASIGAQFTSNYAKF